MSRRIVEINTRDDNPINAHDKPLVDAIGYLACWGNADKVEIWCDASFDEVTAHYYRHQGSTPAPEKFQHYYTIGAIKREGKPDRYPNHNHYYSTHS